MNRKGRRRTGPKERGEGVSGGEAERFSIPDNIRSAGTQEGGVISLQPKPRKDGKERKRRGKAHTVKKRRRERREGGRKGGKGGFDE